VAEPVEATASLSAELVEATEYSHPSTSSGCRLRFAYIWRLSSFILSAELVEALVEATVSLPAELVEAPVEAPAPWVAELVEATVSLPAEQCRSPRRSRCTIAG